MMVKAMVMITITAEIMKFGGAGRGAVVVGCVDGSDADGDG